jgi:hypothetical protein
MYYFKKTTFIKKHIMDIPKNRKGCPDCGKPLRYDSNIYNPNEQPIILNPDIKPNPELIYKRVLEIGSDCITCGISFNELYHKLKYHENFNFDKNGCLERCLREWFWTSFFHEEAHCENKDSKDDITKLNKHLDCKFILRAESCMKLLTFKESEQNERTAKATEKSTNNALKIARISNFIAILGFIISILGFGYTYYKDNYTECSQDKYLKELVHKQSELNDSIKSLLYKKNDTLNIYQLKR